ncbi:hypothetical protein JCM3770_001985 [Rhodotorula araucariae]
MPRTRSRSPAPSRPGNGAASSTSTVLNHTLAPFYACYLLRSFAPRRGGTYIGSTPDPPRRWKQHMGLVKGGAFKTRLGRPWEMEAIVHGFPSKLQALQFEWAWQNPHASRLLHRPCRSAADPGDKPQALFRRAALSNRPLSKIQVLMYMLTVPPWRAFGLGVTLFGDDARAWWDAARRAGPVVRTEAAQRRYEREREKSGETGDPWGERGPWVDRVRVQFRREGVDGARLVREGERAEEEALERIRVDDGEFFDAHWARWSLLDTDALHSATCTLCTKPIDASDHLSFHLCTASSPHALAPCLALFHPTCLASHLLSAPLALPASAAPPSTAAPPLLPTGGECPACGGELTWTDLVRGSYRRMEEVEGRRKQRTRQRGMGGAPVARGKGKKKAAAAAAYSGDEEGERFNFPTDEGEDDGDPGESDFARTVDRSLDDDGDDDDDDDDDQEAERSFARLDAAQGALDLDDTLALSEGEDIRSPWAMDDRPGRSASPKRKGPKVRAPSLPTPLPPPKGRGRAQKPSSPPAAAAPALVPKRRGRPPKAPASAASATLAGAFGSTKAALSARAGAGRKGRAVHEARPQYKYKPLELPLDVCLLICEAVAALPPAVASGTLRALAFVSRTWSAAAQCALYRNPWLSFDAPDRVPPRTFARLEALLSTLTARPDLARGVHTLDAGRYSVRCQTEAKADRQRVSRLSIALVAACPSLRALSLPFVTHADKAALLAAMRSLALLETFTFGTGASAADDPWIINVDIAIKDAWGTAQWWRSDLHLLASSWPRLRRVVLQARVRGRDGDEGVPWALEAFELALVRSAKLSFAYLDALLTGCRAAGSLRSLTLCEHQFEPGALVAFVEAFGAGVEVLRTTTADKVTRNEALVSTLPGSCPRLKVLALETPIGDLQSALDALGTLGRLESLTLSSLAGSPVGLNPTQLVATLEAYPTLEELSLATLAPSMRPDEQLEREVLDALTCSKGLE